MRNAECGIKPTCAELFQFRTPHLEMPPAICPHCGATVPARARASPECGADESTGWSEAAREGELDLPDDNFDYEEFAKREFEAGSARRFGLHWFWWLVAVLLVAGWFLFWLR